MKLNLKKIKKAYFIGIKGAGMVAIAEIFNANKIKVIGSDTMEKFFSDAILKELKIKYKQRFSAHNIPADVDLVVYSTAYSENNNVEMVEARKRNLKMISYPEILAYLFNKKYGIAVCGTHGKTTTAAMLADVLKRIGLNPTAVVGGKVLDWKGNALVGKKKYFIAETDEYQNKLALYKPKSVIFTSCDFDHPDYFKTFEEYKKVFENFVGCIPQDGFLAVWGDSTDTLKIAKNAKCEVLTYGFSEGCDYKIEIAKEGKKFKIIKNEKILEEFEIQLIGRHNILNATAVIAVCRRLKISFKKISEALKEFRGTARRFEYVGKRNGAILIDDYAHHPEEIKATLKAARDKFPKKRIWTVFHPHTFSRTLALLSEFSQSFDDADKVVIIDIYGSAREVQGGVSSRDLVELINRYEIGKAEYIPSISETVEYLKDVIGENDVVISMGAGNVWKLVDKLKEK
jgi:UDP-N-acetylmuramate--alanine ligase